MRLAAPSLLGPLCVVLVAVSGCDRGSRATNPRQTPPNRVRIVHPERRTITRVVSQPGFIVAYEQTAIYPKMTAFLSDWKVDIGDRVQKNQLLATLFVPELVEEEKSKRAQTELAQNMINQAEKLVQVADANAKAAAARVSAARASLGQFQAGVERWDSEVKRLSTLVQQRVVDQQILDESIRQLQSTTAARDEADATILTSVADQHAAEAALEKAKVDVLVARSSLRVAEAELNRVAALLGYLQLTAPYDGIIVARNANRGDFVLPATGDPSAPRHAPDRSTAQAAPIFVVARADIVRIFIDIPEADANYVGVGTKASVLVRAYRDTEIPATVTRSSWALDNKSRTLRAEIDLPNPNEALLPGMYAYGRVIIERPNVQAIPLDSLSYEGDRSFCWVEQNGRAVRFEIQTGVNDGTWIEVTNHRRHKPEPSQPDRGWEPFLGSESIIVGDTATLVDGESIQVDQRGNGGSSTGGK